MISLYAEVLASLVAAGLLGLLCGWMIQRARAASHLARVIEKGDERVHALKAEARAAAAEANDHLRTLADENEMLAARVRAFEDAQARNDATEHAARAEAIETNRRQVETQERLQHIVRQKNREIVELAELARSRLPGNGADSDPDRTLLLAGLRDERRAAALDAHSVLPFDNESDDDFDATALIDRGPPDPGGEPMLDATDDEGTIVLDEETLARVRSARHLL